MKQRIIHLQAPFTAIELVSAIAIVAISLGIKLPVF
jgi:Tfp pilus assembly major pilin PilA